MKKDFLLDFLTLEEGTDMFTETSVQNYHSTLCNIPEERKLYLPSRREPEILQT
jgi:hypothetical protein